MLLTSKFGTLKPLVLFL